MYNVLKCADCPRKQTEPQNGFISYIMQNIIAIRQHYTVRNLYRNDTCLTIIRLVFWANNSLQNHLTPFFFKEINLRFSQNKSGSFFENIGVV